MGNKVVEIYPRALECYKTQKMCDIAVDIYPSTIKFVPERYKTKEIYHKAVHRCFFIFYSIPDKCKTQEICNFAVSLYFPFIAYCPYKYVTQEMRDEAVNYSLAALKFIGLLQVKLIKTFLMLCMQMKIYSILIKILVMLYLIIMKWLLLTLILIILILIIILIKKILILLF